jgi:hypothetical protein
VYGGADDQGMDPFEELAAQAYQDEAVSAVIRPAAVLPESAARDVLVELALRNVVGGGGMWWSSPVLWQRYDRPFNGPGSTAGDAMLLGSLQVTYGTPTRYAITIYRATITHAGTVAGWSVEALCDEALGFGGYNLQDCPRADLKPPPKPFRLPVG